MCGCPIKTHTVTIYVSVCQVSNPICFVELCTCRQLKLHTHDKHPHPRTFCTDKIFRISHCMRALYSCYVCLIHIRSYSRSANSHVLFTCAVHGAHSQHMWLRTDAGNIRYENPPDYMTMYRGPLYDPELTGADAKQQTETLKKYGMIKLCV